VLASCVADPEDDDEEALTDEQVYDLLHEARLLFLNKVVETPLGQDVLKIAIRQIDLLQRAMIGVMDDLRFPDPDAPPPDPEESSPPQ